MTHLTTRQAWSQSPFALRRELHQVATNPSERNFCYLTGYLKAAHDLGALPKEPYHYWLKRAHLTDTGKEIITLWEADHAA